MYKAMQDDRHEFVELLLENGVSIPRFYSEKRLLQLYNEVRMQTFVAFGKISA